jgi:uncharacterized SAM-binding protein YcdF (DUF218 family)
MNVCAVITVAMVVLLRDFLPYGIILMCVYQILPSFLTGNLPVSNKSIINQPFSEIFTDVSFISL